MNKASQDTSAEKGRFHRQWQAGLIEHYPNQENGVAKFSEELQGFRHCVLQKSQGRSSSIATALTAYSQMAASHMDSSNVSVSVVGCARMW